MKRTRLEGFEKPVSVPNDRYVIYRQLPVRRAISTIGGWHWYRGPIRSIDHVDLVDISSNWEDIHILDRKNSRLLLCTHIGADISQNACKDLQECSFLSEYWHCAKAESWGAVLGEMVKHARPFFF